MPLDPDVTACAEILRKGDPERFLSVMAAPVAAREKLFPIYAFNVEVARAPWVTQEAMIAEMRLQWWRDVLEEIREGQGVRRHEVATPLARVLTVEDAVNLDRLIVARQWDIYRDPFETAEKFEGYIADTSTVLLTAAARSLGPVEDEVLSHAGRALGVANWLRAIPALEAAGRVPLVDGRAGAVQDLAKSALENIQSARALRGHVSRKAAPAMLALWQVVPVLKLAIRDPSAVADGRLDPPAGTARLRLMARAMTGRW